MIWRDVPVNCQMIHGDDGTLLRKIYGCNDLAIWWFVLANDLWNWWMIIGLGGAFGFSESEYLIIVRRSMDCTDDLWEHYPWGLSVGYDFVKCLIWQMICGDERWSIRTSIEPMCSIVHSVYRWMSLIWCLANVKKTKKKIKPLGLLWTAPTWSLSSHLGSPPLNPPLARGRGLLPLQSQARSSAISSLQIIGHIGHLLFVDLLHSFLLPCSSLL